MEWKVCLPLGCLLSPLNFAQSSTWFFFQWKVLSNYCLRVFNEPLSWVDVFNEPWHAVAPDSPCLKVWISKTSVSCGLLDGSLAESTKTGLSYSSTLAMVPALRMLRRMITGSSGPLICLCTMWAQSTTFWKMQVGGGVAIGFKVNREEDVNERQQWCFRREDCPHHWVVVSIFH